MVQWRMAVFSVCSVSRVTVWRWPGCSMGGEFGLVITEREQASAKMSRESCSNERPPLCLSASKFGSLNQVQMNVHKPPAAYLCRSGGKHVRF